MHSSSSLTDLVAKKAAFRKEIVRTIAEDDDPLAAYEHFGEWLVAYDEPNSHELVEVLEEAVRKLKDESSDRRYLKLWLMYARHVDDPEVVYRYLLEKDIGTKFPQLYEEYASYLEGTNKLQEANDVYSRGINKRVRAVERLRGLHVEFQQRVAASRPALRPAKSQTPANVTTIGASLRRDPLKNIAPAKSVSQASLASSSWFVPEDPYKYMTQPQEGSGKRPEKLCFDLSLLLKDGKEFCIQEARARYLGLLDKKWGPPPQHVVSHQASGSNSTRTGKKSSRKDDTGTRGLQLTMNLTASLARQGGSEPTVTINTKEALKDVFGMYNSPERSLKLGHPGMGSETATKVKEAAPLGSKHAPVRRVDPVTPAQAVPKRKITELNPEGYSDDVAHANGGKTPSSFRPFVDDENKHNATPKFRPFVDENANGGITPANIKTTFQPFVEGADSNKTPHITPAPRRALAPKGLSTPAATTANTEQQQDQKTPAANVFSRVFTPAAENEKAFKSSLSRSHNAPIDKSATGHADVDVFGSKAPEPSRKNITVFQDDESASSANANPTTPSVFSRPPDRQDSVFKRPDAFRPMSTYSEKDNPVPKEQGPVFRRNMAPQRPDAGTGPARVLSRSFGLHDIQEVPRNETTEDEDPDETIDDLDEQAVDEDIAVDDEEGYYNDYSYGNDLRRVPAEGRCGQYDVMTPIAERTCEFTSTRLHGVFETPGDRAAAAAKQLFDELHADSRRQEVQEIIDERSQMSALSDEDANGLANEINTLSLADAIAVASSFRPANPCVPSDPQIVSTLLSLIPPEPDFYDRRTETSQRLDELQRFASKGARRNSGKSSNGRTHDNQQPFRIDLKGQRFDVLDKLGEGGFGTVFMAKDVGSRGDSDEDDEDSDLSDDDEDENLVALKVVKPRNLWEFHILRRMHSTLPASCRASLVQPHALYAFRDESFLILDLCKQGTLLDVVNKAAQIGVVQTGGCLDELLVMFFAIELLRFVELLHSGGFIHGDLKIDNCLVRLEEVPGLPSAWSSLYQPSGDGGWKYKGIKMIDFGRTIDTSMYPAGQQFVADWKTDWGDCVEVRQGRPWTYQTDYYGLANVIYCMLFGKYFDANSIAVTSSGGVDRHKIVTQFKRYWQVDLWSRLFDALVNPTLMRTDGCLPICKELRLMRVEMENWLQDNCTRSSNTLKGLLKKVELAVIGNSR